MTALFLNLPALSAQLESLQLAVDYATQSVNARGAVPVVRLHDISNHSREIALHSICHGAAVALAVVQVCSGFEI